ncbi:hypothetical protein K470DRAFT_27623 [Piedraia hortae CBS 480.64]|uniref:DUF659 domain-containing protein n=1 Tax=Piedraia hortae CBS 480.64 TaxID=1314780 RepID=A0A6A7C403_9PEZI|nr:hypothetical protein K470DRAFT_27623 [Piedraia hortae CBS 480.64]
MIAFCKFEDKTSYDAISHRDTFNEILVEYNRSMSDIFLIVRDNCSTNREFARGSHIPFRGCASHCFNIAVEVYLASFDEELNQIHQWMKYLDTSKQSTKLNRYTDLAPK